MSLVNVLSTSACGQYRSLKVRDQSHGIMVEEPSSIHQYNKFKGGTDLSTKILHQLQFFRRDTRWTLRAFRGLLALSSINVWDAGKQQRPEMDIAFKEAVWKLAKQLLLK